MENCPKCGALNKEDAEFCSLCHESFNPKEKETKKDDSNKSPKSEDSPETEKTLNLKPHATPGFGILVSEEELKETAKKETAKTPDKKAELKDVKKTKVVLEKKEQNTQEIIKESLTANITKWLSPAIIATIFAYITSLIVPKEQISTSLGLGKILLSAAMFGVIVSSIGIAQLNLKNAITGWLLGLSSNFLAFNIIFFGSFVLMKININFYTKYFLGSEIIIATASLSAAIALSMFIEIFESKKSLVLALIAFFIGILISWILLTLKLPVLPIIVFISWPASFYASKLFRQKTSV